MAKYVPGDVISANTPLAHVLMDNKKNQYCDYCLIANSQLKICSRCCHMFYCDQVCQKEDWRIHKYECICYKNHYQTLRHDLDRMLLRLYLTLKNYPHKRNEGGQIPGQVSTQKRTYDDLLTHTDDIEKDPGRMRHFQKAVECFNKANVEFNHDELFEHFCKIVINSYSVLNTDLNEIGVSLYVLESIFDHSCLPNSAPIFNGIDLEIRAMKEIQPDERITINYIDLKASKEVRQKKLEQYYFTCSCARCLSTTEDDIDYTELNKMIADMDDNIHKNKDWQKAFDIGMETIPIYRKIYGDYHPDLTVQSMRICKLLLLIKQDLNNEDIQLISSTSNSIKITFGCNHQLHRLFLEAIA